MVNTKKKGARKENLCANDLKKEGFTILYKSRTVKQGPIYVGLDFGDLFDIVAVKETSVGPEWIFVSVKHESSYRDTHLGEVSKFKQKFGINPFMLFEVWVWYPAKWRGRGKNKRWVKAHWEKHFA